MKTPPPHHQKKEANLATGVLAELVRMFAEVDCAFPESARELLQSFQSDNAVVNVMLKTITYGTIQLEEDLKLQTVTENIAKLRFSIPGLQQNDDDLKWLFREKMQVSGSPEDFFVGEWYDFTARKFVPLKDAIDYTMALQYIDDTTVVTIE